jgi:hypothetical protein
MPGVVESMGAVQFVIQGVEVEGNGLKVTKDG